MDIATNGSLRGVCASVARPVTYVRAAAAHCVDLFKHDAGQPKLLRTYFRHMIDCSAYPRSRKTEGANTLFMTFQLFRASVAMENFFFSLKK